MQKKNIKKIYYASSSSIYGDKGIYPTSENIQTDQPISIYGVTKITTRTLLIIIIKFSKSIQLGLDILPFLVRMEDQICQYLYLLNQF